MFTNNVRNNNNDKKMSYIDRRQREKEEIKQKILDATLKIGKKEGWQSVTIRKIADEIEYTPPIVYEHFENKEDLIKELVLSGFGMLKIEFDKAKKTEQNAKGLLKKLSLIHWDFASTNLALYQLMFRPEKPAKEIDEVFKVIRDTFNELSNNDEEVAMELSINWICLMHGAISLMLMFPPPQHQKNILPRDLFIKMVDRYLSSI